MFVYISLYITRYKSKYISSTPSDPDDDNDNANDNDNGDNDSDNDNDSNRPPLSGLVVIIVKQVVATLVSVVIMVKQKKSHAMETRRLIRLHITKVLKRVAQE